VAASEEEVASLEEVENLALPRLVDRERLHVDLLDGLSGLTVEL
jgi:hypothetical protein